LIELIEDGRIFWDAEGEEHIPETNARRIRGVPTD
jgi:hypothetical protein